MRLNLFTGSPFEANPLSNRYLLKKNIRPIIINSMPNAIDDRDVKDSQIMIPTPIRKKNHISTFILNKVRLK